MNSGQSSVRAWLANERTRVWLIVAALFIGNLAVLAPWLSLDEPGQTWNNGYLNASAERLFRDYSWSWDPLQYGGAPFRYLYPPVFQGIVALCRFLSVGHAFHILSAVGYAATPVGLFFLLRVLFGSDLVAAFGAIAYSVFPSPAYVMAAWHTTARPYANAPWPFVSLVNFYEAPHTFSGVFVLLAMAAAWTGRWRMATVLAGLSCLINWAALIGLGMALAALFVARVRSKGIGSTAIRTAAIAAGAYGLSAFWITPGYALASTLLNRIVLRHTLPNANWSLTVVAVTVVAAAILACCFLLRVPEALAFGFSWAAIAGATVVAYTLAGFQFLPSSHRYMQEFNLALIITIAGLFSLFRHRWRISLAVIALVAAPISAGPFFRKAWSLQRIQANPQTQNDRKIAGWLASHMSGSPFSRVFVSGEMEGPLNVWTDLPQVGGIGQGISNFLTFAAQRQVAFGCGPHAPDVANLWLRALNVRWIVFHGAESREYFHWFTDSAQRTGEESVFDDGAGDTIHGVAAPGPAEDAVVVDLASLRALPSMRSTADEPFLASYVSWAAGKRSIPVTWDRSGQVSFHADLGQDEAVLLKTNNDPGWKTSDGQLADDPIGFQLIRLAPGSHDVRLTFGRSTEAIIGLIVTVLTAVVLIAWPEPVLIILIGVVPAGLTYFLLLHAANSSPGTMLAEDAFVRLHPPMINPSGIVDAARYTPPPFQRGSLVSAYGLDFGASADAVRVWVGGQAVVPVSHAPNQVNFVLPPDTPQSAAISIEVNGCRGNAFSVSVQ